MVPFKSCATVSYSHSVATMVVSLAVSTQHTNVTWIESPSQVPHDSNSRATQPRWDAVARQATFHYSSQLQTWLSTRFAAC